MEAHGKRSSVYVKASYFSGGLRKIEAASMIAPRMAHCGSGVSLKRGLHLLSGKGAVVMEGDRNFNRSHGMVSVHNAEVDVGLGRNPQGVVQGFTSTVHVALELDAVGRNPIIAQADEPTVRHAEWRLRFVVGHVALALGVEAATAHEGSFVNLLFPLSSMRWPMKSLPCLNTSLICLQSVLASLPRKECSGVAMAQVGKEVPLRLRGMSL